MAAESYVRFIEVPNLGRTRRYRVTTRYDVTLGEVHWYGPWRQYIFDPVSGSLYSAGCMDDIGAFCRQQTKRQLTEAAARAS